MGAKVSKRTSEAPKSGPKSEIVKKRPHGSNSITDEQMVAFQAWLESWLAKHCETKGVRWSQRAVGERLGITQNKVSKWQGDKLRPGLPALIHLYKVTGVHIERMLGVE
jgi:hypothetical protein